MYWYIVHWLSIQCPFLSNMHAQNLWHKGVSDQVNKPLSAAIVVVYYRLVDNEWTTGKEKGLDREA